MFLIEGANAVSAAIEAKWPLDEVLVSPDSEFVSRLESAEIPYRIATREVLEAACDAQTPPPVLAIGTLPGFVDEWDLTGLLLVIDGVSDPGNIGTLLRAADAAGAQRVILTEGSADVWSPKVVRAAAGSLFSLPPLNLRNRSASSIADVLSTKEIPIFTAQAHSGNSMLETVWPRRCALVLGHETRGISVEFATGTAVTIPVYGRAESLNVAMAGTLLCYAWANRK